MRLSTAWRLQARSDLAAARKLAGELMQPETYCQVAAKAQQTVEKSLKALQSALHHANLYGSPVDSTHQVSKVASAIRGIAPDWPKGLKQQRAKVLSILSDARMKAIKELDALVPQFPAQGTLARRNTEYPFQERPGPLTWRAPAEQGVFAKQEIQRFLACAQQIQDATDKLVSALELTYP